MKRSENRKGGFIILFLVGILMGIAVSAATFLVISKSLNSNQANSIDVLAQSRGASSNIDTPASFRAIASKALPLVVELDVIESLDKAGKDGLPWDHFFREDKGVSKKVSSLGSGIIVKTDGKGTYYILTNNHVAGEAEEIAVILNDQRKFKGKLVGRDVRKDAALVSFKSDDFTLPVARLGDSDSIYVGDWVLAIGSPLGYQSSVTAGIVSALGRSRGPKGNINDFIQTDASINQGNSGGALLNVDGEVIGMNTWISTSTGGSIGLGFSIPINNLKTTIEDILQTGKPRYGWLGVSISDLSDLLKTELGYANLKGTFVLHVFSNSPAAEGGLKPGDLILAINGKSAEDSNRLTYYIGEARAGDKTEFVINRFGEKKTITVLIGDRNEKKLKKNVKVWPGVVPIPLTAQLAKRLKIKREKGIILESVYPKSAFQIAGLAGGDIIVSINKQSVENLVDFYKILSMDKKIYSVEYIREGKKTKTKVRRR